MDPYNISLSSTTVRDRGLLYFITSLLNLSSISSCFFVPHFVPYMLNLPNTILFLWTPFLVIDADLYLTLFCFCMSHFLPFWQTVTSCTITSWSWHVKSQNMPVTVTHMCKNNQLPVVVRLLWLLTCLRRIQIQYSLHHVF